MSYSKPVFGTSSGGRGFGVKQLITELEDTFVNHQSDVIIYATTDAAIVSDLSANATSDAARNALISANATSDTALNTLLSENATSDAYVLSLVNSNASASQTSDAALKTLLDGNATSDAALKTLLDGNATSDAYVLSLVNSNASASATSDAALLSLINANATSDAALKTVVDGKVPLAGGTMTGDLKVSKGGTNEQGTIYIGDDGLAPGDVPLAYSGYISNTGSDLYIANVSKIGELKMMSNEATIASFTATDGVCIEPTRPLCFSGLRSQAGGTYFVYSTDTQTLDLYIGDGNSSSVQVLTVVKDGAIGRVSFTNNSVLTNLADPTSSAEPATKNYVDTQLPLLSSVSGSLTVSSDLTVNNDLTVTGDINIGTVTGTVNIIEDGQGLALSGSDHVFMRFRVDNSSYAYIGYGAAAASDFSIENQYGSKIILRNKPSAGAQVTLSSDFQVTSSDGGIAQISAMGEGSGQGTGILYAGQNSAFGGGMIYNGDDTPDTVGTVDHLAFFTRNDNADAMFMSVPYNSVSTNFYGDIRAREGVVISSGMGNNDTRPAVTTGSTVPSYEIRSIGSSDGFTNDDGFLRLRAGGGTSASQASYIDISGYNQNADMLQTIKFCTNGAEMMAIKNNNIQMFESLNMSVSDTNCVITMDSSGYTWLRSTADSGDMYIGPNGGHGRKMIVEVDSTSTAFFEQAHTRINTEVTIYSGSNGTRPLSVYGNGTGVGAGSFLGPSGEGTGTSDFGNTISIYADNNIAGATLIAYSDNRIKEDINALTQSDMNYYSSLFDDITMRTYKYKDKLMRGSDTTIGFIAQELYSVSPMLASNSSQGDLPDYYRKCPATLSSDGILSVSMSDYASVSLEKEYVLYDAGNVRYKLSPQSITAGAVHFPEASKMQLSSDSSVFLYGTFTNDFHVVNWNKINTLHLIKTKSLEQRVQSLEAEIDTLRDAIIGLGGSL